MTKHTLLIIRDIIDEMTVAQTIFSCTKNDIFCQHYCLYLLCREDADEYRYCLRFAKRRQINLEEEFLFTGAVGSPLWYGTMNDFICKFLLVRELMLDRVKTMNLLVSYV